MPSTLNVPATLFSDLYDLLREGGGFTFNMRTGRALSGSGFVVANPPGNVVVKVPTFTPESLTSAIQANAQLLQRPGYYLGGWRNEDTGIVHLEVSQVFEDRDEAIAEGRARREIAIFDLSTLSDIRL